ncbi:uncharacterized protein LOC128330249 isoform X2 [Hemicordylus capensis]|uniref:uncharacterized protein LOC128330249 isoform X2 n=1 Tax=Hemicordylus capensis TaxID=884348 RepID=UPI0023041529|nr:uncharacterized protein LOC128330249 isoform X2 [Hemicordylus capensis]
MKPTKQLELEKSFKSTQSIAETKPKFRALQDAFDIISHLKGDNIDADQMRSTLNKMGVILSEKEFRELLRKAGMTKDSMVNFNSFMSVLGKTRRLAEFSTLKDAIQAMEKIESDKVMLHELPYFMRNMGIHLSDQEFQDVLKQVPVDGSGKIVVKDFMKILTNKPYFSELSVVKDTIQAVSYIEKDKVFLQDLRPTLRKMGIRLNTQEYEELLKTVSVDREGKVDIGQVIQKVARTQRFSEMEVLNNAIKVFSQVTDDQLKLSDVETYLSSIGVHLNKAELAQATRSLKVSFDGSVDIHELMSAVKSTRKFSNYAAVHDVVHALKVIKEHKGTELTHKRSSLHFFGVHFANQVITQVLKSVKMSEAAQTKFNDFLRTLTRNPNFRTSAALMDAFGILSNLENDKIGVEELQVVMKSFSITLPAEEVEEALSFCIVDELQLTCMVLSKLKDEHFNLPALESTLDDMDLPEAQDLLHEVMKTAHVDSSGRVDFREFMRIFTLLPEFPGTRVLKDTFNAMNDIKNHHIQMDGLATTLANVGINLLPEELKELQQSVTPTGDGTVSFKDVMMHLTGTQSFAEFTAIQNGFDAISKICREKIKKEDLPAALENLGIHLSPDELQTALVSANIDASGKLDGTEFLKILSDAPRLSEFKALQDATKIVESIKNKKMTLLQLEETLDNMGVYLSNATFNEVIRSIIADENGEIDFQDFLQVLGETEEFIELEALQRGMTIISAIHGSRLNLNELESTLYNLGINLKLEEFQQAVQASYLDAKGTVNLRDFLMALSEMHHFSDSLALHSAIKAFGRIKDEKVEVGELETVVESLGISLSNDELQQALRTTSVDESGKVNFKEFLVNVMDNERFSEPAAVHSAYSVVSKVTNDKIEVTQLQDMLAAIGITLTQEEMKEALKKVTVDSDGKVNLKEFMNGLSHTRRFSSAIEMEEAIKTLKSIKQGKVNVEDLDSILHSMGLHLSPHEILQALEYVTENDDGTVNVREFMFGVTKTRRFSEAEKDRVSVENLDFILENMGIHLTEEEMQEVLQQMTVDEDGKINLSEFMKSIRVMKQLSYLEGTQEDMVAVADVDYLLSNMGIYLTKEQLKEALKHVTIDENGKVHMSELMKSVVKIRRQAQAEKDRIDIRNLDGLLANMSIYLTYDEIQEALKYAAVDEGGKVNMNEFLKGMKIVQKIADIEGAQGNMIAVEDINSVLSDLEIHLTKEQLQEALKHATLDEDGKVNLNEFMKGVRIVQKVANIEGAEGGMITVADVNSLLSDMGIYLNKKQLQEALKHATLGADGKVNMNELLKGVMIVQKIADLDDAQGGMIDVADVDSLLSELGIHLTKEQFKEALQHATLGEDGKVNLNEFMKGVRIVQKVANVEGAKGVTIDVLDVNSLLSDMGIHLTREELLEALQHVTLDADGKVNLDDLMKGVKIVQKIADLEASQEGLVAVGDVDSLLSDLGIHPTKEQLEEALKHVTLDEDGKVNISELMKNVTKMQRQLQVRGKAVEIGDLSSTLAKMGIHLTEEEMQEALKYVIPDADGRINLKNVLEGVMATRRPSQFERDRVVVQDLKDILASADISLTEEEMREALKHTPVDAEGKVNLAAFMKAVKVIQPYLQTDQKIAVQDLGSILARRGIYLNDKELQESLMNVEVNADGTVNLGEFMKGVEEVRGLPPFADGMLGLGEQKGVRGAAQKLPQLMIDGWTKEKVDINSLDAILDDMGIHLTNKQLYEALKYAPVDADGKVDMEAFRRGVTVILKGLQTEKRVNANIVGAVLASMGFYLTQEELQETLKRTRIDKDGTVNLKDFMWAAQELPSIRQKKIDVGNVGSVLAGMGIYLTREELRDALSLTVHNEDGTVNLNNFIKACNDILTRSSSQGKALSEMSEPRMLKLPKVAEKHHLQTVCKLFSSGFASDGIRLKTTRKLSQPQLEAFRVAYDTFSKDLDGYIDLPALETTAHKLGISLTEEEAFDELVYADADGDGRVSFLDFLSTITDSKRFIQAVAPKKGNMEIVDAQGILFFELLSKLVESCLLPKNATENIVSYYRQKFLDSTGKRAWHSDGSESKKQGQKKKHAKKAPSGMTVYAGAARIGIMKDNELRKFVAHLQASSVPSDSPYAQVPIFPLIPNRDTKIQGKPKKDIHKLEAQRRMEPVSSFEDHFFNKKRWMPKKTKPSLGTMPTLTLAPDLTKRRRLTMSNLEEIRREVKKATDAYRKALALRERNKSLKLWRRVRGNEIGVDVGNPSFYQTFSTYSWSWNVCQELVTPRELQEYDNKLYYSSCQTATPAGGRQKGSKK